MGAGITSRLLSIAVLAVLIGTQSAYAHVSEQGIVLLLPTDIYIFGGCVAVISSMLIVALLPHKRVFAIFKPITFQLPVGGSLFENQRLKDLVSLISLAIVITLIVIGAIGTRDPLVNLLPLTIWTVWWIAIFMLHILFGNLWDWINPWTGLYNLLFAGSKKWLNFPSQLGHWPAIILYIAFYIFIVADLAPDDPARLSNVVLSYLFFTFVGMIIFGADDWLRQVECFTVLLRLISRLSPIEVNSNSKECSIGLPGWKALRGDKNTISQSFFLLTMLASGSFDGVNETFWWLAKIGINPLAFPGRSAVVTQSTSGMVIANILLYALFAFSVWMGIKLVLRSKIIPKRISQTDVGFKDIFNGLAISVLPIAAVYHGSHYLTSFMVNGQYLIAALSDPLANGSNLLGLVNYQVTTGYLNEMASVQRIWLSQASIVVIGHVIAVLMAHFAISQRFPDRKEAVIFHIPIAIFMAGYTWFGLWLLAAPKGA